jgi:hypothetical protein
MAAKLDKLPWLKFHPQDWRGDAGLRMCSLAARGLWIEMLGVMHEAEPYGHLVVKGKPVGAQELSAIVGAPIEAVEAALAELENWQVCDRNRAGTITSRRMIRDAKRRDKLKINGSKGGNPALRKTTENSPLDNQPDKPIEARDQRLEKKEQHPSSPILEPEAPPRAAYVLTDGQMEMITAFDDAIVTTWGEGARRRRPAGGDPETAQQLLSLGISAPVFKATCLKVMGRLAVMAKGPPGALSYCLKAAMDDRSAAPMQFAVSANGPPAPIYTLKDEAAERLASFGRTGVWLDIWGPRPEAKPAAAAKGGR